MTTVLNATAPLSQVLRDEDSRTPRRSCRDMRGAQAPSTAHVCDPPCLSMRNNAPVEHCVAEAFILHREIVLTMKPDFTLRAYHRLTSRVLRVEE